MSLQSVDKKITHKLSLINFISSFFMVNLVWNAFQFGTKLNADE